MPIKLLPLILFLLLFGLGCRKPDSDKNQNTYESISMSEALARMQEDKGYILVDVRREDEFIAGHIPGAINIPNETIGTFEISLLPNKRQNIYVYCRSGSRSKQASSKLVKLGYTNIIEIGGILDYNGKLEYGK